MSNHYLRPIVILASFTLVSELSCFGQVNITGPTCVTPSTEYQYNINANWIDSSDLQVCVHGGVLNNSASCYAGRPISFIRIIWAGGNDTNKIVIHSTTGDTSLSVSIASLITGGSIDSLSRMRLIDTAIIPATITCSAPLGGNCSPVYTFQWEQSLNNMNWSEINGANSQHLQFSSAVAQTTYYRRKTTEKFSGTEGYSNIAILVVNPLSTNP